ncbi:Perilipin-4 [Folsomia candida]|uniref:Perilipin-4 n=1 Tax=Folsomia candida TaxID=158441 RepID=A0A226DUU5_FOLCA|nr:Perilipin-4 [Folsomia candida]
MLLFSYMWWIVVLSYSLSLPRAVPDPLFRPTEPPSPFDEPDMSDEEGDEEEMAKRKALWKVNSKLKVPSREEAKSDFYLSLDPTRFQYSQDKLDQNFLQLLRRLGTVSIGITGAIETPHFFLGKTRLSYGTKTVIKDAGAEAKLVIRDAFRTPKKEILTAVDSAKDVLRQSTATIDAAVKKKITAKKDADKVAKDKKKAIKKTATSQKVDAARKAADEAALEAKRTAVNDLSSTLRNITATSDSGLNTS